jgi:hypothetical protein
MALNLLLPWACAPRKNKHPSSGTKRPDGHTTTTADTPDPDTPDPTLPTPDTPDPGSCK